MTGECSTSRRYSVAERTTVMMANLHRTPGRRQVQSAQLTSTPVSWARTWGRVAPPIDAELRDLIRRMWRENRLWGENRIAGELAKLGWRVSPRTVAKYRPKHLACGRGQCWTTFVRNHASQVWACDFFTVVTLHFQTLYAFVVISLERRETVHVGVTAHPTGAWIAQRMIEAVGDAPPGYLLLDRDSIYDVSF